MLVKSTLYIVLITLGVIASNNHKTLRQQCNPTTLPVNCGVNQACEASSNNTFSCKCFIDFIESNGECIKVSTTAAASTDPIDQKTNEKSSSGSSVAAGLLIPTFLIIFGGIGFCCAKKYKLLPCRQNIYENVVVTREEDDYYDPPIID